MKIRKVLIVALIASICLTLYFSYAPASAEDIAFTEQDGLCVHHPEHTQVCGYYLETGEETCIHIHDETCGYVAPTAGSPSLTRGMGAQSMYSMRSGRLVSTPLIWKPVLKSKASLPW